MREPTDIECVKTEIGRWEWVGLPEFGIACMKARMEPSNPVSVIRASDVTAYTVDEERFLKFRVFPLPDDYHTFIVVDARRDDSVEARERSERSGIVILTVLTIGDESFPVSLEVVETADDFPLTLGRDLLARRFRVDIEREAVAGPPSLSFKPRRH